MGNLNNSIVDRFTAIIKNGATSEKALVAIATANFDTLGVDTANSGAVAHPHHHNLRDICAAGYNPDVIFDDLGDTNSSSPYGYKNSVTLATLGSESSVAITMQTTSNKTVASMKEQLRLNPRFIKRITIAAVTTSDSKECPQAFNHSMFVASINPFQHEAAKEIDLSQYFATNQFQSGKIVMDYANGELQWNDMFLWMIEVMAGVTLTINVDFYNE